MISIKIEGVDDFLTRLALAPRQIEIATQRAMLKTAQQIHKAEKEEMQRVFDRPTRWTLGSMRVKVTNAMEIKVGIVDPEGAYKRANNYLGTQIRGGPRGVKAMESALRAFGLPSGWKVVPSKDVELDEYGNMSGGQIKQILAWFRSADMSSGPNASFGKVRSARKSTKKRVFGFEYFVVLPGNKKTGLIPGVYQRFYFAMGKSIKPILIFVNTTNYKSRFDFDRVARQTFDRVWPVEAEAAVQREIKKL